MNIIEQLIEKQCDDMATGTQCKDFLRNNDGSEPLMREMLRLNLEQFCQRFDPAAMQQIGDLEKDFVHSKMDVLQLKENVDSLMKIHGTLNELIDQLTADRDTYKQGMAKVIIERDEAIRVRNEAIAENNDMRFQRDEAVCQLDFEMSARRKMEAERDEADRRAGAAERKAASLQDDMNRTEEWFRQAKRDWSVEQNFSFDIVWDRALHAKNNSERLDKLRRLCGYVENGSSTVVKLQQDDATREWILNVDKKSYYAGSFFQVIDMAVVEED